jgi:uncharacterized protein
MKLWSRYNTLFCSKRYGWFLHNALSGVMLELDERHYRIAKCLCDGKPISSSDHDREFIEMLEENGFLAQKEAEKVKLMTLRYQRNAACFSTGYVGLTICPTLACNFGCLYCFEQSQDDATVMSDETIEALMGFIRKHQEAKHLYVIWYGGEPLLAFHVMENLTAGFLKLYPDYDNAILVTNGYLLDERKIERLNHLKISSVQITLDGSEKTHNQRRILKNGGPTYERIFRNIDLLMASSWKGKCSVRVNVDRGNRQEYAAIHKELLERYKGENLKVYPGYVKTFLEHSYDRQCGLCLSEWTELMVDGYKDEGIVPRGGFFPESGVQNICIATSHYGHVIGPKGEMYKCWEDVGKEHMVIGSVHEDTAVTNPELVARYTIGTDPYQDAQCLECNVFPICGGGCVNKRLRSQQFVEPGLEYCSPFKESLRKYLEAYLETWQTKQICSAILGTGKAPSMEKGYCMVQPEKSRAEQAKNPLENLAEQE